MKNVLRILFLHLLCIFIFTFVYYHLKEDFRDVNVHNKKKTVIDYITLSVTIQSGVGLTYLEPTSPHSKIAVLIQQLLLISNHVLTLYVFTI